MNRVLVGIRSFIFISVLSFQAAFATAPLDAQGHANQIVAQGTTYTAMTPITNIQVRQDRFLDHIIDQHFGLNPNSYAIYQPVGSEDKKLRSEFILTNGAAIDGAIGVVARRQAVEIMALHNYAYETLTYRRPTSFKDHLTTIGNATSYNLAFLTRASAGIVGARTATLQAAIDALNNVAVWNKLLAICNRWNALGAPPAAVALLANVMQCQGLIAAAATGGTAPLSTRPTSAAKVAVITGIRAQIGNLLALQRLNDATAFPDARAIAQGVFEYAMGLPNKRSTVARDMIDIHCPLPNPVPNPVTADVARMVSQTPWYDADTNTMITQAQRPDAGEIMIGFLRYDADDTSVPPQYHIGNLDYLTMFSSDREGCCDCCVLI